MLVVGQGENRFSGKNTLGHGKKSLKRTEGFKHKTFQFFQKWNEKRRKSPNIGEQKNFHSIQRGSNLSMWAEDQVGDNLTGGILQPEGGREGGKTLARQGILNAFKQGRHS